jgi:hypothetical protein
MESPLSRNEREALSRFIAKLIEDVDRLATLFESRGADSAATRLAKAQLERTLQSIRSDPPSDDPARAETLQAAGLRAYVPDNF